jgi:hypothetical protein
MCLMIVRRLLPFAFPFQKNERKVNDRVLFDSFEHGWVVGTIASCWGKNRVRIVYYSPLNGHLEEENAFGSCPRVRSLPPL